MSRYEILRKAPSAPEELKEFVRQSRSYYLTCVHLRNNPPNEKPFLIKELAEEFEIANMTAYQAVKQYQNDSRIFVKYCPIPEGIDNAEKKWEYAIGKLHRNGFYMPQPLSYHSHEWGEPSFHQFEEYNLRYFREGVHRIIYRLEDAKDFGLQIDGISVRKELASMKQKAQLLGDYVKEESISNRKVKP